MKIINSIRHYAKSIAVTWGLLSPACGWAQQEKEVLLKYGDMDQWIVRKIHESGIIGGATKTLYEIGPAQEIDGNEAYKNLGGSPWGTSNVMAKVMGITKTNTSVYQEARGEGHCARLETHIESVKVAGLLNITVLAAGSVFLGEMHEPITGTRGAEKYMNWGVPFTGRPKALRYDYRVKTSGEANRIRLTGFSRRGKVEGRDCAITVFVLQKRTEDADGNITAHRVGTMIMKYDKDSDGWVSNATYEVLYGDITSHPSYDAESMGLRTIDYAVNSKGKSVLVRETGWAEPDETPTHMALQFTSSHGGAFVGSPGNTFWIDNVRLIY